MVFTKLEMLILSVLFLFSPFLFLSFLPFSSQGGWPSLHLITQTTIRPRAFISLYGVTNLVDPAFTDLPPSPLTTALLASPSPALQALISDPLPSTRKAISGSYMNLAQMHGIPFPEGWYAIAERNELDKESWDALGKSVPMTEKHLARALLFAHFGAKGLLPPAMSGPKGDQVDWKSAPLNALTVLEEDFPPTYVLAPSRSFPSISCLILCLAFSFEKKNTSRDIASSCTAPPTASSCTHLPSVSSLASKNWVCKPNWSRNKEETMDSRRIMIRVIRRSWM